MSFSVSPETDVGVLVEHDSVVILHTLKVEDNKSSYEVSLKSEMELTGFDAILKKYKEIDRSELE